MRTGWFVAAIALVPVALAARDLDRTAVVYRAVQVVRGTVSETVLVPETFQGFDAARPMDSILRAFDALKHAHPDEYGNASLLLDGDPAGTLRATLNLDPANPSSHLLVAAEVFHTLKSLGVAEIRAPALRQAPLDAAALPLPVYLMAVPYHQALPPRHYLHAVVFLSPSETLPSEVFYQKLDRADPGVMDRVLAGLVQGDDRTKLSVLAAIPHLNIAQKARVLLPLLDDPSAAVRLAVLKLLQPERADEVTRRLAQLVEKDRDAAVKLAAARILSERGLRQYDIFLEMDRLNDPSDEAVLAAIGRLVESRNPVVAPGLYQCLTHRSQAVRDRARKGLAEIGATAMMVQALSDARLDLATREAFALELAGSGARADRKAALAFLVESGSESSAIEAVRQAASLDAEDGLPVLYRALLRPEAAIRDAAVEPIVAYRDPRSIPALLGAARSGAEQERFEAAAVRILATQPASYLLSAMEGSDPTMRRLAMKAFGDSLKDAAPPSNAVAVLKARLGDPDVRVRRAAVYALARVPDETVASAILDLSRDPDPEIRAQAMVAAVRSSRPDSEPVILRGLSDESEPVVLAALTGVATRRLREAKDPLRLLCSHGNPEIRRKAVQAYAAILEPGEAARDLDFLTGLLYVNDPAVKLEAIQVVRQVHERRAIVALSSLVIDPNRDVKAAAIEALASTKELDALEGVEKGVFDPDPTIRLLALDALGTLGRPEAVDFLNEVIRTEADPTIRARAEKVREALRSR